MIFGRLFNTSATLSPWSDNAPIREQIFGVERLEELGRSLASLQRVTEKNTRGHGLADRLADNAAFLLTANRAIAELVEVRQQVTPAAEWLIDNYHLVDMQIREIGIDLPSGYYSQLPKLAGGPLAGFPRVFGTAWGAIAHTDSYFDTDTIRRYLIAYQEVQPLTIGELWAVPITLRIVLIENLRRVAAGIVDHGVSRREADNLADRLLIHDGQTPVPLPEILASVQQKSLTDAFAVQLAHRLRGQDTRANLALAWLDQCLEARNTTIEVVVRDELQRQGTTNATIRNIITSLRLIAGMDWTEFFERVCLVDKVLADHSPFLDMDFPTRNLYRTAIEELARGSRHAELDIAHFAARAAMNASAVEGSENRRSDPGYYLFAAGRPQFETELGYRPPLLARLARASRALGISGYGGAVVLMAGAFVAISLWILAQAGLGGWGLVLLGVVGVVPASDAAVAGVNRLAVWAFGATALPGLELRAGISTSLRTLVAVPTLLTTPKSIAQDVARIEIHFLASQDGDVHFALLSDWTDSATEHNDDDEMLLAAAADGIARLNRLHGPGPGGDRFILLHRHRVWNASEERWIGWERKRGKLHELNRLLRGAVDTSFLDLPSRNEPPKDVRFVVTLDADTRLPRDALRRLVGKMAHPLNTPRFDPVSGRVLEGYAVLQPRVTPSLPLGRDSSLFQRIFSTMDGIDPYAAAVSDVYQDMFGEGSYAGKGIYDVDAFEAALAGRVPDSTLLSHDLFEGVFARAGLASDIEVVEEFPSRYAVAAMRQHRWARGDWQLLPWILPWGSRATGGARGAIPAIGRWKMLDNLRRTLSAPATILAFLAGWLLPFDAALGWTAFVLSTIAFPALLPVLSDIAPRRQWVTLRSYLGVLADGFRQAAKLIGLNIVFLAHQAVLMGDAITRTLIRVFWTRRNLLQWVTAAQTADDAPISMVGYYRRMTGAPAVGILALGVIFWSQPWVWLIAVPFAAAWIASPALAHWASQCSAASRDRTASTADIRVLRMTARQTWRYFETFVTRDNTMLPPDNFQEDPAPVLAHRTSPTNFGLYLLSVASAHDFGWIGLIDTIDRLEATLATMSRLPRFKGHFYNWYDTADLRPLDPKYVSTVDSGNVAGHLIAVANACRGWREGAIPATEGDPTHCFAGLDDAIGLGIEELKQLHEGGMLPSSAWQEMDSALIALASAVRQPPSGGIGFANALARLDTETRTAAELARALVGEQGGEAGADLVFWTEAIQRTLASHQRDLGLAGEASAMARLATLEHTARDMALEMEFGFLRNEDRKLLSIGYLVDGAMLDDNCYDLLASEARLAVFVAIAKGDVPAREWFRLGRAVTPVESGAALVSWSGSMFEYLMPSLIMRAPAGSLLEQTNQQIVQCQIDFGTKRGIPWGLSESAYNVRDIEYTYQYSNFGVPGLGLKRGLGADAVVAPYATALAAMVDPQAAVRNLARLEKIGARGRFGFYEALDFTPARVPDGKTVAVVRAFMAHHQGMTIVAIANAVLDGIMRSRFHAEPIIEATELLLQERAPRNAAVARPLPTDEYPSTQSREVVPPSGRRFNSAHSPSPATHLLSNGRYAVMLTTAGSGYSRWQDLAVTRWREDATLDDWGSYVYLRDVDSGHVWSAGVQPIGSEPDEYEVAFSEDRAEFARRDGNLTTMLEVLVSTEEDAEVRRISISNAGTETRTIDITSYAELALAPQAADIAHPAFAKLFVETEYLAGADAILATRRRRTPTEPEIWAAHLAVAEGGVEVETDRARFLGRGHGVRDPMAMTDGQALSGTVGTVLDAIFSLRCRVTIAPGAMVRIAFWTMVATSREALVGCIDRHRDVTAFDRASTLAWTQAQVELRHLGLSPGEADLFQRLAGHVLFAGSALRPNSDTIRCGGGAQSGLWGLGISGDLPIVLLRIRDSADLDVARQILLAHEYFRMKRLAVDLVILNEHAASYSQELQGALEALLRSQPRTQPRPGRAQGSVFLLRADLVPAETCALLIAVARVVLLGDRGSLSEQLDRVPAISASRLRPSPMVSRPGPGSPPIPALEFANGMGGFAEEGREYVVILGPGKTTPAPWINVIANPVFGFQVAGEGSGYTWAGNSRENQITPWSNDPITDRPGEAFFIRDDETQNLWCPTAAPRRDATATYVARHGRGYSRFDRTAYGIASSLLHYVPIDDPIKISRLTLHNTSDRTRSLSVSSYVEWVLGPSRTATAPFVVTEIDDETGAMFASNPWNAAFGARVAFADLRGQQTSWTGDRCEFIGRNGSLGRPEGLAGQSGLSNRVGAGMDPCGALRTTVLLPPGGRAEIVLFLGQGASAVDARTLVTRYRLADLDAVLSTVRHQWDAMLGAVAVETPNRSMDILLNGWLLYQTLACRVWARAGFYQASGAYGFRDQLQDGMALVASRPDLVREHLLRATARQFTEGDVQHWWLPQTGMGVRTRISDDCTWLAYTVAHYVEATGDTTVLDEPVAFLAGPPLGPDEHDRFFKPAVAAETRSLFDHCARALDHSLALGSHGLPLIGTGDWNDGMSRIGEAGKGESVWLGWFLHATLTAFAPLADARHDTVRASRWRAFAGALQPALERTWDGEWYLRAFFDDGTKLGSHTDEECRIDSIPQSWAVISGVATPERAARAMASVERELVTTDGLVLVLAPPFDKMGSDPGYIKGYPPGIRENGGQYTHAALWSVMAFAALGDGDKAAALFARLNPINHALHPADVSRYKVEPYVVVADIYSTPPHIGRGGWSWYTGSAGWMQRAGIESILGIRIQNVSLHIDPCIPRDWPRYKVTLAWRSAQYQISVDNPGRVSKGVVAITLDGRSLPAGLALPLTDDGAVHIIHVTLGL